MKTLKTSTTKQGFYFWKAYQNSTVYSVNSAYRTQPSIYKVQAENQILQRMYSTGGRGYRILSHSGFVFTCGYMLDDETLIVDTRDNTYIVKIDGEYRGKAV